MRVILAQPRGFCAGVVRAVDIVERALELYGAPIYVRHEIIHNRHVVDDLRTKGAIFVDELDEVPEHSTTVFSAHGVAQSVENEATRRHLHVLDATCPLVKKVHRQGRHYARQGYMLILIGHANHPEVVGTLGQIPGHVTLVQNERDVASLHFPPDEQLAYITQTTLSVDDTQDIIAALKRRFPDIVGPDTRDICYATQNRQMAVRELSRQVEAMLVVGAVNSSNSVRLCEIAADSGIPSYLVSEGSEVRADWIRNMKTIGITAGASAPDVMIDDVISALRQFTDVEICVMPGREEKVTFYLPEELLRGRIRPPHPTPNSN
ncbi:4-hydroxy-3-methylbut-2-enyl diphosphate reductase [Burkholderia sp. Bp9126]|nr:4-hydroxy-3-methylbut-2-enyl diphosphate reductase [Burkholderia sp. Bp9126]